MTCLGQFGIACAAWLLAVPLLVLAQAPRSPAERAIESARIALAKNSEKAAPYNRLAMALARRARETSDPVKYEEASAALEKSFELEPDNFEGLKIRAWLLLGRHEFARALDLAEQLKQRVPDDATVYGLLTDAHTHLGNYKKAEEEAQRMLDVGRASVPGLTRAAYLRELFGDIDGATELMVSAYRRTNPAESEDRAWILTQVAHLHLLTGRLEEASRSLDEALRLFPGYHYALAHSAKVLAALPPSKDTPKPPICCAVAIRPRHTLRICSI